MAVNLRPPTILHPVAGVRLAVAEAAIKRPGRGDLVLIELCEGTQVSGVFTQNAFAAAPVQICRSRLSSGTAVRGLVINSGNANAATGQAGINDALAICEGAAAAAKLPGVVLPFSTGVIGQRLPVARMLQALPAAAARLHAEGWMDAMAAIMTTDTVPKGASRRVNTSQGTVTVTGIAKGVGMIHPDMATMLAFIGTDARLSASATRAALQRAVGASFNCVTVDGDTSTNDSCVLFATGRAGAEWVTEQHPDFEPIAGAIESLCLELAQAVVRDGEGATKFIAVNVNGARTVSEARQVGLSIAHSPLVKTAMFAADANWGRIAMAVGKAGVAGLDARQVSISLNDVVLMSRGELHSGYSESQGAAVVSAPEFAINVDLGMGKHHATVWTCDFSYDYVKINAEYRT